MKKFLDRLALLAFLTFTFTGCVNSIIDDAQGSLDNRNIELRITNFWEGNLFSTDSVYNKNGARFKVDDVQLLFSNFFYDNAGDTTVDRSSFTLTTTARSDHRIGLIMENSISGGLGFLVGLDSVNNATGPGSWSEGDVLSNSSIYSNAKIGYNFITITGRAFDPNKPNETSPSISFKWVVATNALVSLKDIKRSFSVPVGKQVVIDAFLTVDALFDDLSPAATPFIKSDPDDATDFANAQTLSDNFNNKAFVFN